MNTEKIIKHIQNNGALLAKNMRPIHDILCMDQFVGRQFTPRGNDKYYRLIGFLFGRPILVRLKRKEIRALS